MSSSELTPAMRSLAFKFIKLVDQRCENLPNYLQILHQNYGELLKEDKIERICKHCNQSFLGKAIGPHVKEVHKNNLPKKEKKAEPKPTKLKKISKLGSRE